MSRHLIDSPTLDIHGGGRDLVFPHHENERAQSESLTGKALARYWIHHGLLTVNGQKMAKSLGNFFTIKEVLRKFRPDVLKLLFLQAHYASPVDFSWAKMEEARRAYERLDILISRLSHHAAAAGNAEEFGKAEGKFYAAFMGALADDFNMPQALAVMFEAVNECNKLLDRPDGGNRMALGEALVFFQQAARIFCLSFRKPPSEVSDREIEEKIRERLALKKAHDFSAADRIRAQLLKQGIILEDTKDGTTWRRSI
jgi:cysteinyl-tRNA synthetase